MTPLDAFRKLYEPMSPSSWRRISAKPVKDTMADKQDKCGMVLCCIKELDGVSMGYWCSDDGYYRPYYRITPEHTTIWHYRDDN
jgi:hypothetical protein